MWGGGGGQGARLVSFVTSRNIPSRKLAAARTYQSTGHIDNYCSRRHTFRLLYVAALGFYDNRMVADDSHEISSLICSIAEAIQGKLRLL